MLMKKKTTKLFQADGCVRALVKARQTVNPEIKRENCTVHKQQQQQDDSIRGQPAKGKLAQKQSS